MLWLDTTKRGSWDRAKKGTRNHQVWDSAKHWNVKTQINGLWRRPGMPEIDEDTQIRQECELSLSRTPASRSCQLEVLDRYLTQRRVPVTDPEPAQEGLIRTQNQTMISFSRRTRLFVICSNVMNEEYWDLHDLFALCQRKRRRICVFNLMRILHHTQTMQTILWSVKRAKKCILMLFQGRIPGTIIIGLTAAPKFLGHIWIFTTRSICLHQVALRQSSMTDWVLQSAFYPRHTTACALSPAPRELLLNNCHLPGCPCRHCQDPITESTIMTWSPDKGVVDQDLADNCHGGHAYSILHAYPTSAYWTIEYTAAARAGRRSLPTKHQCRFLLRSDTPQTITDCNPHLKHTALNHMAPAFTILNHTAPYGTIWQTRLRVGVGKGI
jgi:hypothetical protein